MFRTIRVLPLAVLAMLVLLRTSAASQKDAGFTYSEIVNPGKKSVNIYQAYLSGQGVKNVRLYLVRFTDRLNKGNKVISVPSKYLSFSPAGSDRYKKMPSGRKYWERTSLPRNYTNYGVKIAVKVRPNIPRRTKHCVEVYLIGTNKTTGFRQEYPIDRGIGFCTTGREWLTPIISGK